MGERDTFFRKNFRIKDSKEISNENMKKFEYYRPDLVLETDKEIIVLEHSSSGDRKVHIGELSQFVEFSLNYDSDKKFSMILLLDGKGETSASVSKESNRLKYYVETLFNNKMENINFIGVVKYDELLNNLLLYEITQKCECVYKEEFEYSPIKYRKCIEIVCSNAKSGISNDDEFIQDVVKLIESEFKEKIYFDINPSDDLDEYMEYPIVALGDIEIDNDMGKSNMYLLILERQTINGNLILKLSICVEEDYIYTGINDKVYELKAKIKNVLSKGFRNIYWQFDEHNNGICNEMYSKIHVLENEFRQLIIEFMVKSYGYQWEKRVNNDILKKKIIQYSTWYKTNYEEFKSVYIGLFNLQVSDLIDFLKSVYETEMIQEQAELYFRDKNVYNKLAQKGSDKIAETIKIKLNDILYQNSIWNLYMIGILGEDFIEQWNKFEKIRNMVAHNKPICDKLYKDFGDIESILIDRFKNFREYIQNKFDLQNKENIDMLRSKREIEIQGYEEMYREEAGLGSMPKDEEDVFEEINEHDDVIEFNNLIEEYVYNFNHYADELLGYLEDIDCGDLNSELNKNIIKDILCIDKPVDKEEFQHYIDEFTNDLSNKVEEIVYESEFSFAVIDKLYGLWDGSIEISIEGTLCIAEGNVDKLEIVLRENNIITERGSIEKTYGEYYISDYGAAMPEVGDDLQVKLDDVQAYIDDKFYGTIEKLKDYISLFDE
ncbi:MAG: hypothetical protein E6300_18310 [Clostridium sp.]|uniref:hypothetical protein n=1 Tax=Clostridium sp. TaxID=1506 RepID=UPI0029121BAD|nr:hypothetical protein [Clostridium sp.]MDU7150418.1 hypothetical protein [Clostridium sp.]